MHYRLCSRGFGSRWHTQVAVIYKPWRCSILWDIWLRRWVERQAETPPVPKKPKLLCFAWSRTLSAATGYRQALHSWPNIAAQIRTSCVTTRSSLKIFGQHRAPSCPRRGRQCDKKRIFGEYWRKLVKNICRRKGKWPFILFFWS